MRHAATALCILGLGCAPQPTPPEANEPPGGPEAPAEDLPGPAEEPAGADRVRVADIVGSPGAYVGRTVTVEAEVDRVLGPMAFRLDEDAALAGGIDNDLLVLGRRGAPFALDPEWEGDNVVVTGIVGQWTAVDLEREVGWDLEPEVEAELEEARPVLIATSVERTGD